MERAYNSRSTRPLWHYWKPQDPADKSHDPIRSALCGAKARDSLLDANTDHVHGCGRCDERHRKAAAK